MTRYETIETDIVNRLGVLRPAALRYWDEEGQPPHDSGPYIFFSSVVACYVEILLAMRETVGRHELLEEAFAVVDEMLGSPDRNVRDLAFIEMFENAEPWWLRRALPFLGGAVQLELDRWQPGWLEAALRSADEPDEDREVIDLYGVRDVVMALLRPAGDRS